MATAITEVSARDEFDYEVVNADPEKAQEEMIAIMQDIVKGGA
jgi:guanylate kinase